LRLATGTLAYKLAISTDHKVIGIMYLAQLARDD